MRVLKVMKRKNIDIARELRKNQTEVERKLWGLLRNRRFVGIKFRRQFPVDEYILDFYSVGNYINFLTAENSYTAKKT